MADLAEQLFPCAGMRNVLVHEYVEIDLEQVAAAVPLARTATGGTWPPLPHMSAVADHAVRAPWTMGG